MGEFDDFLQPISADLDIRKRLGSKTEEVLYSNSDNPEIIFLLEKPPSIEDNITGRVYLDKGKISKLVKLIQAELKCLPQMKILSAIPFFPRKQDLNKTISDFYSENKINLCKYIKPFSRVITEGRALYAITESSDLSVKDFYDFVFSEQQFYAPDIKSYVFPMDSFNKWFNKDNFESFFAVNQIKNAYTYSVIPTRATLPEFHIVEDTEKFFRNHWNEKKVAIDVETSSLDFMTGRIGIVTMSFDGIIGYLLRWKDINIKTLSNFLRGKYLILANAKFDFKYFIKNGVDRDALYCSFDTLHAGHLLNEMRSNSLKTHAWLFTRHGGYDKPLDKYKKRYKIKNYLDIPDKILFPYATYDPVVTFQVYDKQERLIKEIDSQFENPHTEYWTLWRCFNEIVMPYANMFVDIEYEGIPVNWDRVREVSKMLNEEIEKIRKALYGELGIEVVKKIEEDLFGITEIEEPEINIDSGKELGLYLEKLGWKNHGKGKANYYLTNDAILEKWTSDIKSREGAKLIINYRELITLQKTFIGHESKKTGIWQYRKSDDRVHPNYGVMLTHSGRNWCKNPNIMNCPKHGKWAKIIRSIFTVPSDEYLFAEADYSGLQLRIGAIYSRDKVMLEIFTKLSGDMHSMTAFEILTRNKKMLEVETDKDVYIYYENQKIEVKRNGKVAEIEAIKLKEGDIILECPIKLIKARDFTLKDFLKYKKSTDELKFIRFKAKAINFGFEFGQVAFSFAKDKIEREWTLEECKEYIKENDLYRSLDKFKELINRDRENLNNSARFKNGKEIFKDKKRNEEFAYYWCVAYNIRIKYFETYKGLELWHRTNHNYGGKNGFIPSSFGIIRRVPQLICYSTPEYYKKKRLPLNPKIKNLYNITLNSPVQAFEIGIVALGMIGVYNRIREKNLKSRICGTVHDSCMFFIHKNEIDIMKKIIVEEFAQDRPEYKNIPIEVEGEISDAHAEFGSEYYYKNEKGEVKDYRYWGFGKFWFDSVKEKIK